MSRDSRERLDLLEALNLEIRAVSAGSVLFSQLVAAKLNMNSTDLETVDILLRHGPTTAGRLAKLTGLTTAGVTGVVDRLEAAGYAQRERDPHDRRRVIVHPVRGQSEHTIGSLYAGMARAMAGVYAHYSDQELALILDFARRANLTTQEQLARLRELTAPAAASQET